MASAEVSSLVRALATHVAPAERESPERLCAQRQHLSEETLVPERLEASEAGGEVRLAFRNDDAPSFHVHDATSMTDAMRDSGSCRRAGDSPCVALRYGAAPGCLVSAVPERYVLAIDLGTGSVKTALVSAQAEVAASAARPFPMIHLPGGGAEQDPAQWWSATCDAARETLREAGIAPEQVIAVKCTTQWAVTVPVDADGRALTNAISWLDTRGGRHVRRMVEGPIRLAGYDVRKLWRWVRLTGAAPTLAGVDGLGHALHLRNDRPEIWAKTHRLLEPMDYLNLRLSGRFAASYGTIFPYWLTDNRDIGRIDYHPALLQMAGIEREKLPDLLPVDAVLGTLQREAAEALGLATPTKVLMGTCDGHSAALGAGCVEDGDGYFSIGTTSWLSCHVPAKKSDLLHRMTTMPAAIPGRYVVMAEQGVAGRCLDFVKDNLFFPRAAGDSRAPEDDYAVLEAEAARVPAGSHGLVFTPWLGGVVAPDDEPCTRSAFINQTLRTTRGHYVRAVMEGVAFNLRWLGQHVERFVGRPFPQLGFVGGAAQSETWCRILADVLDRPIRQIAHPRHANAVGAALAAFTALGELRIGEIPGRVKVAAVHRPDPARARVYDARFAEFLALYRRMKPVYRRLNRPSKARGED